MSELERQESEFAAAIDRLNANDAPRAAHQESLRAAALEVYRRQASHPHPSLWQKANQQGRAIMRRPISRYAAGLTAIVLVLAGWMTLHKERTASAAFYEFATALVTANSAHFKMEVTTAGQANVEADVLYLAPARMRQTLPGMISISDMQAGKMVTLKPEEKKAMVVNFTGRGKVKEQLDIFERLRAIIEDKSNANDSLKPIGEKEINGRRALGFREDSPMATLTIWGDPQTGLPLRIETVMSGIPRTEVTWSDFELNVDLDESLFDTTPPADYEVQSFEMDASPFKEQDLIQCFRLVAEINEGVFPESIDSAASQQLIVKSIRSRKDTPDNENLEKLMQVGAKIGRGFSFALQLPNSADAHYAGKGVQRDTPETPIFWYRPEGAKTYRVINADLSVHEVEAAPQVPGAVRIGDANPQVDAKAAPDSSK